MIAETEAALVKLAADCLGDAVDVASGPGSLDGGYVTKLLGSLPAVRVVFLGADDPQPSAHELTMQANWAVLVFTGWNGQDEEMRRIGTTAAYAILARLSAIYHHAALTDENGNRLSLCATLEIENLWSSAWDLANVAVYSLGLQTELELDIADEDLKGALDDWLRVGASFSIPGGEPRPDIADAGEAGDIASRFDLPQT